ncbi:hypothetical protein [Pseudoalteromonas luteoviolacea]|uniref:Uncharacterized protein n=1 Tax=Pseudoalteromonas luteoviolacea S4054 TaxID=1129367 RepID=A0A0F6A943_9GAMM|nr:hypothetical protein [Pseudoalteromonas luteoviolacea]KKE82351.1 hypothetical protein N479_01875 [Pseudoalteromonas luteoviolacea S4054]KZN77977.1 hypothetical protein N481_03885 [Pseudoalteromonas luteoviolacea S4047-1]
MMTLKTKKLKQLSNLEVLSQLHTKQIGGAQYNLAPLGTNTIRGTRPPGTTDG